MKIVRDIEFEKDIEQRVREFFKSRHNEDIRIHISDGIVSAEPKKENDI